MRLRGCLARLLLAGGSVLISLVLIDAGMRIVARQQIFLVEHRPDVPQIGRFPPNQVRSGVMSGDLRQPNQPIVQSWQVHWVTDAYGYENATIPSHPDTLVLADSFGSVAVSQESLVAARLSACGRHVYNLSVSVQGPWQEYATLVLEQDRLNIQPGAALIWMLYSGNDVDDLYLPVYGDAIKTGLTHQGPGPYLSNYLLDAPLFHLAIRALPASPSTMEDPQGRSLLYYSPYVDRARRTADDIRAHPNYPLLRDTFKAMAEDARQRQIKPLIIIIPSKEEIYYYGKASGFGTVISQLAADNHMPYINLTPLFLEKAASGEFLYLAQDTHWNEYAQQIVTGLICRRLGWAQ